MDEDSLGHGLPWKEGQEVSLEELAAWERKQLAPHKRQALRNGEYWQYLSFHDADERMAKLAAIWDRLSDVERRECLEYAWSSFDAPHLSGDIALTLFRTVGFLTDAPDALPPGQLTIFRGSLNGLTGRSWKSGRALSWTLDSDVARWFAQRLAGEGNGIVLQATVNADDVLAHFVGRKESEVIVDPASLRNVQELPVAGRVTRTHPWISS